MPRPEKIIAHDEGSGIVITPRETLSRLKFEIPPGVSRGVIDTELMPTPTPNGVNPLKKVPCTMPELKVNVSLGPIVTAKR